MASTVQSPANLAGIAKSTWTSDRLEKAFFNETPWLDKLERTNRYTIGDFALVPIHTGRSGGHTVTDAEGGTLNNPTKQKVGKAQFGISYNWKQIGIETGALNQVHGGASSVADALELEITGGLDDLRYDVTRQSVGTGDGVLATTGSTTTSNTVNLATVAAGGYGWDYVRRGFLRADLEVDIGTAGNPTSVANDVTITDVNEGADDGTGATITVSGSTISTSAGNIVSLHGSRDATGNSKEMIGLRGLFGSTGTVGNINPATAGNAYWKPYVDTTTTVLSLDLLAKMQMKVYQRTGKWPTDMITSAQQISNYWSLLQNQTRYAGDSGLDSGNVDKAKWKGITPVADPAIPDRELYLGSMSDLILVTGKYTKPTWVSDVEGVNRGLNWVPGTTRFQDAIFYSLGLGAKRRNGWAAATNLVA